MKKRIKTPDNVVHLNDPYLKDKKIVHIKTTPAKNGKTHIYWNKNREELIVGSKVHFPVLLLHILNAISSHTLTLTGKKSKWGTQ